MPLLTPGEQPDGSIVDMYGNVISLEKRLNIIQTVEGLPATLLRDDIKYAVDTSPITIIIGETGSGKTTQIPKMFIEDNKRIVVTQPRVLAAMSNANRVSQELLSNTGNPRFSLWHGIGYRTGRWVSSSRVSPLGFHTDWLELMRQAVSKTVPDILFMDEVHNFAIPTELLAMMSRYRTDAKIVIMSATLDPNIFQEYYSHVSRDIPVIKIPGRTFPVEKHFNASDIGNIEAISQEYQAGKNVLFFVPGKKDIEGYAEALKDALGPDAEVYPLHSEIPEEEQQKLLVKTSDKPRVIVSTNVAEESITIDYIDTVVDTSTHKVMSYNRLGIPELRLKDTSQANCLQRAGRSWRTKPGKYIRTSLKPFDELASYPEAPIEREMLDKYILILLANGIDIENVHNEESFNGTRLFFHDFDPHLLKLSYQRLKQIWAIDDSKKITALGRDLLKFPLDVYNARILREAIKRRCVKDMVYAVAILEKKWFVSKDGNWKEIKMSGKNDSDLFAYSDLFKFVTAKTLPESKLRLLTNLGVDPDELADFIDRWGEYKLYELVNLSCIGIKNKKIREIDLLVEDLFMRLEASGVEVSHSSSMSDKKICIVTGNLHNIYEFRAGMFRNRDYKEYKKKDQLEFKAGNVTLVWASQHHLYVGQPFIIGWDVGLPDLNLLTFLTQIDGGHIKDALLSTKSFLSPQTHPKDDTNTGTKKKSVSKQAESEGHEIPALPTKTGKHPSISETQVSERPLWESSMDCLSFEQAALAYAENLEQFERIQNSNVHKTQERARDYYLRYCLPDFLIAHNVRIRKYLKTRSENEIYLFRELLARFLLESEACRISPQSLEKTELWFKHDSTILDRFFESKDPYIMAFRRRKKINLPAENANEIIAEIPLEESANNRELFELKKRYAAYLGSFKRVMRMVDVEELKHELLWEHFRQLDIDSVEYNKLWALYEQIGKLSDTEVQSRLSKLKDVERKRRILQKLREERQEMVLAINNLEELLANKPGVNKHFLFNYKIPSQTDGAYQQNYIDSLKLALSENPEDTKRGRVLLETIANELGERAAKLEADIVEAVSKVDLKFVPHAAEIKKSLETLSLSFFEEEYFNLMMHHRLLDITREIYRDQITERKGLEKIVKDFFFRKKFSHARKYLKLFGPIEAYSDVIHTIEAYLGPIYQEVRESRDMEKLESRIKELEYLAKELDHKEKVLREAFKGYPGLYDRVAKGYR